ncbi:hypothetical protein EV561_1529 [Rhizobium sp. BK376]|nr:hypothetical protein EV561_1529 [Rhizobium sp. BK376]
MAHSSGDMPSCPHSRQYLEATTTAYQRGTNPNGLRPSEHNNSIWVINRLQKSSSVIIVTAGSSIRIEH